MMTQIFNLYISRSMPLSLPRYTVTWYQAPFMDRRRSIMNPTLPSNPSIPSLTRIPFSLLTESSIAS